MLRRKIVVAAAIAGLLASPPAGARPARPHSPPPGSAERREIVDGLRASEGQDRIYVIRKLRVLGEWAVITVDPQSRDGKQHYEGETVILHYETGIWVVLDYMCTEADQTADGTCNLARSRKRLRGIVGLPAVLLD